MPSVLFVSLMSGSPWGGSEELWFRTAIHAVEKGWKVGCVVYHWPQKEEKLRLLAAMGVKIYYLPNKGKLKKDLSDRIWNKISKFRASKMIRSLPYGDYNLVVVNQGAFETVTPSWNDVYKKLDRYILLFHNYKEKEVLSPAKAGSLQRWINGSGKNLFAAKRIMEVIQKNSGVRVDHADILLNPITFEPPVDYTPYPPSDSGAYRFTVLAALDVERKAQDRLIIALTSDRWKQRNFTLHLYGEGKDRLKLQQLIDAAGLSGKVFLEGQTTDVKKVLANSHLLLQVTHMDAMPLSVVEAMAVSRPVIVSQIGDMPEWVQQNHNGWISENASVEAIDKTLETAWNNREKWEEMGRNAFRVFQQKFPASPEETLMKHIQEAL